MVEGADFEMAKLRSRLLIATVVLVAGLIGAPTANVAHASVPRRWSATASPSSAPTRPATSPTAGEPDQPNNGAPQPVITRPTSLTPIAPSFGGELTTPHMWATWLLWIWLRQHPRGH